MHGSFELDTLIDFYSPLLTKHSNSLSNLDMRTSSPSQYMIGQLSVKQIQFRIREARIAVRSGDFALRLLHSRRRNVPLSIGSEARPR